VLAFEAFAAAADVGGVGGHPGVYDAIFFITAVRAAHLEFIVYLRDTEVIHADTRILVHVQPALFELGVCASGQRKA
jgi:hypothetical protein